MPFKQQLCFTIITSIFCAVLSCYDDDLYVIRTGVEQNLVLDGSNSSLITLQFYTNSSSQHWNLQRGDIAGLFYIINNHTGKVLDLGKEKNDLVLKPKEDVLRQQWNLALNGRIVNSQNSRNVDVQRAKFVPGNRVMVWENNWNQAQWFVWTKLANSTESTEPAE